LVHYTKGTLLDIAIQAYNYWVNFSSCAAVFTHVRNLFQLSLAVLFNYWSFFFHHLENGLPIFLRSLSMPQITFLFIFLFLSEAVSALYKVLFLPKVARHYYWVLFWFFHISSSVVSFCFVRLFAFTLNTHFQNEFFRPF